MGISTIGRSTTDNWELITTSSPSAASTVTLSSIDTVYSKLLITFGVTHSGSQTLFTLTANNDSTAGKYMSIAKNGFINDTNGFIQSTSTSSHILTLSGSYNQTASNGLAYIFDANTNGGKRIESHSGQSGGTAGTSVDAFGFYEASAAITRLDITGPSMTGTVKLYGVRA